MSLSQYFRSPFVRIPFLAFAVFSSVATSQPEQPKWTVDDETATERVLLRTGEAVVRQYTFESSEAVVSGGVRIEGVTSGSTPTVRITSEECRIANTYEQQTAAKWIAKTPYGDTNVESSPDLRVKGTCSGGKSGTFAVRIENTGKSTLSFAMRGEALATGTGDTAPPEAFVNLRQLP